MFKWEINQINIKNKRMSESFRSNISEDGVNKYQTEVIKNIIRTRTLKMQDLHQEKMRYF